MNCGPDYFLIFKVAFVFVFSIGSAMALVAATFLLIIECYEFAHGCFEIWKSYFMFWLHHKREKLKHGTP